LKETLTSFDIAAATHEINRLVEGAYIVKVYQIGMQTLLFKLRKPDNPRIQLLFEAGKRIHLTDYAHETPTRPSAFCMSLRKYLDNGVVKAVKQHEFERIIVIEIAMREGVYQLVVELFGGGNVILVDPAGKILQAMTYKRMRDRNIIRGEQFQQPPARGKNPYTLQFEDLKEVQSFDKTETVRALTKLVSISGTYAEEVLLRAGVDKKTPCNKLTDADVQNIFGQLETVLAAVSSGNLEPRIVSDENGEWVDVTPLVLKQYDGYEQTPYETFNKALDDYFAKITHAELVEESSGDAVNETARYMRILQKQQKALEDLKEPIDRKSVV
jgi:predicted ribosome quality control (RQC) complex YloA/Tae2 family protein